MYCFFLNTNIQFFPFFVPPPPVVVAAAAAAFHPVVDPIRHLSIGVFVPQVVRGIGTESRNPGTSELVNMPPRYNLEDFGAAGVGST